MKYTLYIIMVCLIFTGCRHGYDIDRQLSDSGRIMVDKPQEALAILSDMDTLALDEPLKVHRALLQAYIAVTWLIPVDISEADMLRVFYAYDGDCTESGVKALIVKSEMAKIEGNPVAHIEYLKDAEFLAGQLDDRIDLGFIYLYLSQVYANGFNGTVSGYYANKSRQLFDDMGHKKQSIDARMAYVNSVGLSDTKIMLDSLEAMRADVDRYSTDSYKRFYLGQLARALMGNRRNEEAICVWRDLYPDYSADSNTLAHWAQAYLFINKPDSASMLIEKAISIPHGHADEYLCRNVQYDILQRMGLGAELAEVDSLRSRAARADFSERQLEKSSLAINQKFESATRAAWSDLQSAKSKTRIITIISIILVLICGFSLLYYRKRMRLMRIEHENDMLKIQCLRSDLFEREHRHDVLSERIAALFKSRFEVIDKLAASYFECRETGQEQKRIFSEAKALIGDFGMPKSLRQLEEILNANRDDLMIHFDADYPRISQAQRKLALFIFCGLSLQSISVFLNTDLRNIYVYKSRLKSTIARSGSSRRETYLEYFA